MKRRSIFALLSSLAAVSALVFALSPAQAIQPGGDIVACVFNGSTNNLRDIPSPGHDVAGNDGDVTSNDAAVSDGTGETQNTGDNMRIAGQNLPNGGLPLLDTEDGNNAAGLADYTFATLAVPPFPNECLHADIDGSDNNNADDNINDSGLYSSGIVASGSYQNLVCGTGTTVGNATLTVGAPVPPFPAANTEATSITTKYFLTFVAGVGAGVFTGDVQDANAADDNVAQPRPTLGVVALDIQPRPNPAKDPPPNAGCVNVDVTDFDVDGIVVGTTDADVAGNGQGTISNVIDPIINGSEDNTP